jgi:hypothetical protein
MVTPPPPHAEAEGGHVTHQWRQLFSLPFGNP